MRAISSIFLIALVATTSCSLLEMSQSLWTKLLEGGLTKIGVLDPLKIPLVRVDQSEGNTSYRMILRNVKIIGLNFSSLESVYVARGRVKTNLTEHEAGYVSYTDQRELDTIRYRFHTVVKEPKNEKSQNFEVKPIPEFEKSTRHDNQHGRARDHGYTSNINGNSGTSSRYRDNQEKITPQGQRMNYESSSRYENDQQNPQVHRSNYELMPERRPDQTRYYVPSQNSQATQQRKSSDSYTTARFSSDHINSRYPADAKNIPGRVRVVYAERQRYSGDNDQTASRLSTTERSAISGCARNCEYQRYAGNVQTRDNQQKDDIKSRHDEDIGTAASVTFESRRAYVDARLNPGQNSEDSTRERIRNNERTKDNRYATTFDANVDQTNYNQRKNQQYREGSSSQPLEKQPGYVDIVYADDKDQKVRHFGNLRVQPGRDMTVYSLEDILRDLRDHKRFIIHNFTEGEALTKKNDAIRTASETKRIEDLARYAKDFQEKQGYYEQGMQLIYHYGGQEDDVTVKESEGRRTKRAHLDDGTEDDVMHVIMRIRVPMLQVNAEYVLTGKVGKQVLRGNGLLAANFTELIGDFTLELSKVNDDTMIVRAARARLSADEKKITLEGMDEEGPVKEILTQGLMAAEAVAAMLADDLTTKALSEKTADSIIYRMYKNLPSEN